jgi:predicted MFS family arabinose efflux permease
MSATNIFRAPILPVIVLAQFACTSLWFAGNVAIGDRLLSLGLPVTALGHLVISVQSGFITGTLLFALLAVADRFSPSLVFFACALLAASVNLFVFISDAYTPLLISRFLTGFFLAGIYPVGMKIAADYHSGGLGTALGWLVGALVLGTAFPHLVKMMTATLSWEWVISVTAFLSLAGGSMIRFFVPDGPYRSKGSAMAGKGWIQIFSEPAFRSAAFGYFGHMWELYAFWAFVPVILRNYALMHQQTMSVAFWSFLVIGSGMISCIAGGYLARYWGSAKVAARALQISAICCLVSPLLFQLSFPLFLAILFIWGMAVIMDSPQFSTLVAASAPPAIKGTALTITNSIGFGITIISIETLNLLQPHMSPHFLYLLLAPGPILGWLAIRKTATMNLSR